MHSFQFIRYEQDGPITRITLSRPDIRNAFNDLMIAELNEAINEIRNNAIPRLLILSADGSAFCAGADLTWMKRVIDYDFEHNVQDAMELADLLWSIEGLPCPTIAVVQGPAVGGGVGLVAACDIVLASSTAWFALSEVKLGLAPAVISPFLLRRMGDRHCRELFLTGKRITAQEACSSGLVNAVAEPDSLPELLESYSRQLGTSAPGALEACKKLLRVIPHYEGDQARHMTARIIAELRVSQEGQEGMNAFLEKRKAGWIIS